MVSRRQIKQAIKVLEEACEEEFSGVKYELKNALSTAKSLMEESDKKILALSHDQGMSQIVFGFTEDYVKNLEIKHSKIVKNFINLWCTKQADWRYPWCFTCPNHIDYVYHAVKSHLVYVCTNHVTQQELVHNTLTKVAKTEWAQATMFRVKPLEFTGHIRDQHVPFYQIGTAISLDYVPYFSIEQIRIFISSLEKILRPGGQALVHYADGELKLEWESFINKEISFCSQDMLEQIAKDSNLKSEFFHIDTKYSFVVLTKPGAKVSIKGHLTKIESED